MDDAMARQEGGQCSIGPVRARIGWLAAAAGVAGAAAYRVLRRKQVPEADPRAEELRRKIDESKPLVDEREEFESAETTIDEAEAEPEPGLEDRRQAVHERGRAAAEQMRGSSGSSP
jgi:hypothetical protein